MRSFFRVKRDGVGRHLMGCQVVKLRQTGVVAVHVLDTVRVVWHVENILTF